MNEQQMLAVVMARHDQDEAATRDWFARLPFATKAALWDHIEAKHENPLTDAMSLLASLQFERFAMGRVANEGAEGKADG